MSTKDNLAAAFAGESQANRKYLMFAEQAEKDGFKGVAKLFRATAEAETIHAFAEFRANGGVGTTAENLQAAINGETYEFSEMYPPMIKEAEAEGDKTAARVFHFANEADARSAATSTRARPRPTAPSAARRLRYSRSSSFYEISATEETTGRSAGNRRAPARFVSPYRSRQNAARAEAPRHGAGFSVFRTFPPRASESPPSPARQPFCPSAGR